MDGVVAAFNYDGGQRAAFALAVLDSAIHFDDITDIGERREAGWPPARPVPGVVSFTGLAHIYDVEDPEEIASSALMQSMDSLTEALTDGSFLTSLQGHPAFADIKVDLDATLPLEATVAYDVYIPPAPRRRRRQHLHRHPRHHQHQHPARRRRPRSSRPWRPRPSCSRPERNHLH